MSTKHLINLSLVLVAALVAAPAADAITTTITATGTEINWHTPGNWDFGVPRAGDIAVIPEPSGSRVVIISDADAVCEVLQLGYGAELIIRGRKLEVGDQDLEETTSTLNGTLRFEKAVRDNVAYAGELVVYDWVNLQRTEGDEGEILASYTDNQPRWGTISRAPDGPDEGTVNDGVGVKVGAGIKVEGHLQILCSLVHDGRFFGVETATDQDKVMRFGDSTLSDPAPPFHISTTTSAGARSAFSADGQAGDLNRIEFHAVTFGSTAPNWVIFSYGEIEVSGTGGEPYWGETPFDIEILKGGLLDILQDFISNGKLTAYSEGGITNIRVLEPYAAVWRPASP